MGAGDSPGMLFNLMPVGTHTVTAPAPDRITFVNRETVAVDPGQLRLSQASPAQVLRYPIANGRADAPQILAYLQSIVAHYGRLPELREFARTLLPRFTRDNDVYVIVRALSNWVRDSITYLADPAGSEFVIDPLALIGQWHETGKAYGDCDDHVLLLNSMLNAVGLDTLVVGVHLHDPVLWDHVISSVALGGRWVDIDPCLKTNEMPSYTARLVSQ